MASLEMCRLVHCMLSAIEWCLLQRPYNLNGCRWYLREAYGIGGISSWKDILLLYDTLANIYPRYCGRSYR